MTTVFRLFPLLFCFVVISVPVSAQRTQHTVIVVIDGPRYSETFGDSSHQYIPHIWNTLRPQGTIYTSFYNNGKTETNPGHASILSGVWQNIANDGSQRSFHPSLFEYYRKQKNAPATDLWVALGKDKLNVLAASTHSEYGEQYTASVRSSAVAADDGLAFDNLKYLLQQYKPKIAIANIPRTDIEGHANNWDNYLASIRYADSMCVVLWNVIQSDPVLKNKTTMIITNDHGRHPGDFTSHGDGCDGCRHIMCLFVGPDTPKGVVDSTVYSQIDISSTVGRMMRFSTPLSQGKVMVSAVAAAANVPVVFNIAPAAKISGNVSLQWSAGTLSDSVTTILDYSNDGGLVWTNLLTTTARDSSFLWNTATVKDGTRYKVRVQIFGDTIFGIAQSAADFTIDNPGNGAPDVVMLAPNRNVIVSGEQSIQWQAADAEGDPLTVSMYSSSDNGTTWSLIAQDVPNSGQYTWNTLPSANSPATRVKIVCSDGAASATVISTLFEVYNQRQKVGSLQQIAGTGTGILSVNVSDVSALTGSTYRVAFTDSSDGSKYYSVRNMTANVMALPPTRTAGDGGEGPLFDGLRLSVRDFAVPTHNKDSTRWTVGSSNLFTKVIIPELTLPEGVITGIPEAADYEIRISDTVVDTSAEYFGATAVPLYFTVFNLSTQKKTPLVLTELSPDGKLSFGDDLYFFKKDSAGKDVLSWEVFIDGDVNSTLPNAGDVYRIATYKPITGKDVFEFTSAISPVREGDDIPETFSLHQNYPNPFNPATFIRFSLPSASMVTVTIYDILGRVVRTFDEGVLPRGTHSIEWNAVQFASGVYFYRLTAVSRAGGGRVFQQSKKMMYLK